jgi:hypothetical protein
MSFAEHGRSKRRRRVPVVLPITTAADREAEPSAKRARVEQRVDGVLHRSYKKDPALEAYEKFSSDHVVCLIKFTDKEHAVATLAWVQENWKVNACIYDVYDSKVHDRVKPFFDFDCEWVSTSAEGHQLLGQCIQLFAGVLGKWGFEWTKDSSKDGVCWSFAKKKAKTGDDVWKFSAHVYVNQGVAIAIRDLPAFKASLRTARAAYLQLRDQPDIAPYVRLGVPDEAPVPNEAR